MAVQDKINIDVFKMVNKAISENGDLEIMANQLTQLLVGALDIKGCTIFVLNPQSKELEVLASSGLSLKYMNKGPLFFNRGIQGVLQREPVVIKDIHHYDRLQYPEQAKAEGIASIVSVPIMFYGKGVGALRLYHHAVWDISDQDLDSLEILANNIGLAMNYIRLVAALRIVQTTVNEIHGVWIDPIKT